MDQLHLFADRGTLRVAVVEGDDHRAHAVMRRLARRHRPYEVTRVCPQDVINGAIDAAAIDAVLLGVDGTAPSMAPLRWLTRNAPATAVVALTHDHDLDKDLEVVVTGAQDVLPFHDATAARLDRAIRAAVTRKRLETAALNTALTDPVTGMASRAWMLQRLELAVAHAATCAEGWQVAVLFCDLDRFKVVNDSLGHAKGDELLRLVAERLRSVVRAEDPVARFGGDEFVILLEGHRVEGLAHRIGLRALAALAAPFEIDGHRISVLASVGLALHRPGEDAAQLLDNADLALFQAKRCGRNRIEAFDDELRSWSDRQRLLGRRLRDDLSTGRIDTVRTSVWNLASSAEVGSVIAASWRHDHPDSLVELATRHGLAPELGRWIVTEALRVASSSATSRVVVEMPPGLVAQPAFVEWLAERLAETTVDPSRLVLALSEAELADVELIAESLDGLDRLGVSVALAGFGSGSSSLALFSSLRVDEVMLAPQLVAGIATDAPRRAVVEGLLRIAAAIGQRVVATGPESIADVVALAELGCADIVTNLDVSAVPPAGDLRLHPIEALATGAADLVAAEMHVLR